MPSPKTILLDNYRAAVTKLLHELPDIHAEEKDWKNPVKTIKDIKEMLPRLRSAIQYNTVFAVKTRLAFDELHTLVKSTLREIKEETKK